MAIVYSQQGVRLYKRMHEEIHDSKSIEPHSWDVEREKETLEVIRDKERDRLKHREMPGGDQLFYHVCARIWLHFPTIPQSCPKARFATGGMHRLSATKTESM